MEQGRRRCADCEQGVQVQPEEGKTECIDCFSGIEGGYVGVDCNVKDAIKVFPGFYRPEAANLQPNVSVITGYAAMAVACPWAGACLGGTAYRPLVKKCPLLSAATCWMPRPYAECLWPQRGCL